MNIDDLNITSGENEFQVASIEKNDKTIDYTTSKNLSYVNIISITKGLDVVSEFYDVNAAVTTSGAGICAVALGKTLSEAVEKTMDSNPIDFMNSVLVVSQEVDSDVVRTLKPSNIVVAPKYTKNAIDILEKLEICYVTINTSLADYKKYLSNDIRVTPLGTLTQAPNLSELNKDTFKVVSKTKPTVEQIEDAVFAWKVAKHANSQAIVIAKDLKTTAISQGLQTASVELALDYSCDMSKDAILASDLAVTVHDINAAAQGRIGLVILPFASKEIVEKADKYSISLITTGMTNALYR